MLFSITMLFNESHLKMLEMNPIFNKCQTLEDVGFCHLISNLDSVLKECHIIDQSFKERKNKRDLSLC